MLKNVMEVMDKAGIVLPLWTWRVLFICVLVFAINMLWEKVLKDKYEAWLQLHKDIHQIAEIRTTQETAINKSIDKDKELEGKIKKVEEKIKDVNGKLDAIIDSLARIQEFSVTQQEASENANAGLKMMLCNELDKRYRRYLELGYIPDEEFDEYCHMYEVYHLRLNGNGTGEAKYNYIMENLERKV